MVGSLVNMLDLPGIVLGVFGAAWLFWGLGVREPFVLTLLSLAVGGPVGFYVERRIVKWFDRRK